MSLLLAAYNNAMRLGHGYGRLLQIRFSLYISDPNAASFNSYTQQICVDEAVLIDPLSCENVVTNDGITMRIMAQKDARPGAWTRQREVITDDRVAESIKEEQIADPDQAKADLNEPNEGAKQPSSPPTPKDGRSEKEPTKDLEKSKPTEKATDIKKAGEKDQEDTEASDTLAAKAKSESGSVDVIESRDLEAEKSEVESEEKDISGTSSAQKDATSKEIELSASKAEAKEDVETSEDSEKSNSK